MGIIELVDRRVRRGFAGEVGRAGRGSGGFLGDLIVGIIGAFIGGWIFNYFGHSGVTGVNFPSIVVAFIGAVVLLYIIRLFSGRRSAF